MKKLLDFESLAQAQTYPHYQGKMISPDIMLSFLTVFNLIDILDTPAERFDTPVTKEAKALRKAFTFGSEFNLIINHPSSQIVLLDQMKTDNIISQSFVDYCISFANPVTYPYADVTQEDFDEVNDFGEVITAPIIFPQHIMTIKVSNKPRKPVSMKVQQRFGEDNTDLTDWHNVGTILNVEYTQAKYSVQIAKSPAPYRELRIVCPLTLGVEVIQNVTSE
tara:strand:+ start:464 stop:1126 length:663 start_codon:yes stop_codon:yes gene_type:complete